MNVGYSTHGCWASLEKIKHLEVEDRGNPWFEDDGLDLESLEGIWVTLDPQKALWYLFPAEDFGSEEYREALKNAETHLFQVDLTGAVEVLRDGEGGFLYIRRKEANQNGKEVRRCGTNQPRKS
jgi:hypothetical protein